MASAGIVNAELLKKISPSEGRWAPVKQTLQSYAERTAQNPTDESIKLKAIIEKVHGGK